MEELKQSGSQPKYESEYIQKVRQLASELSDMTKAANDGVHDLGSLVISVDDSLIISKSVVIGVTGSKGAIVKGLCAFATHQQTKDLFMLAVAELVRAFDNGEHTDTDNRSNKN